MRFLKKFEGYSSELFWEIPIEEKKEKLTELLELDKEYLIKIVEILDSLHPKVKYELIFYNIEGQYMDFLKSTTGSILTLREILKGKNKNQKKIHNLEVRTLKPYDIDIMAIDDNYFIVSLMWKDKHYRFNKHYKVDDFVGLEECLKYLIIH